MNFKNYFLVGGAGFIGSHFIDTLLSMDTTNKVTIYDNFSSGKVWHYQQHNKDARFIVIKGDVKETSKLNEAIKGHDVVMHFAANPDIARAISQPSIDFTEGTYLTYQILEAARLAQIKRIIYTSGSGVYGEVDIESTEDQAGMYPISTYGASKLASEAFICSYCHMFDLTACVFRFANVVGPRQTHGVGYDFINKLNADPTTLEILGDGLQSKSYIHIHDVISAVLLVHSQMTQKYEVYNVATGDYISVRDIANIIIECMNIEKPVDFKFTGGDRGWKGDVPTVRLNTNKIQSIGWRCKQNSAEAIRSSALAMIRNLQEKLR
ncbi:NAD-dependent epimerase/dehydratase family protein [Legionella sp. D16C41]|uniref:NAD-dependent epimerase/dehydratase family protein n=1 Tax=Legionella sp. D16C41 TaxID=3402688 RepID=UPI003AF9A2E4